MLRKIIGASLADSKSVLGLAPDTVKSIQCGRLPFSELAMLTVAKTTGVSYKWLLNYDGSKPPVTENGEKFTEETFNKHEAKRDKDRKERDSPVNFNFSRYLCLQQFHTLTIKLAALMLAAQTCQSVDFVNAKLDNEMRRLAKLLRQEGRVTHLERITRKETEGMSVGSEAGWIAIFNQFKKELPPEKKMVFGDVPPRR